MLLYLRSLTHYLYVVLSINVELLSIPTLLHQYHTCKTICVYFFFFLNMTNSNLNRTLLENHQLDAHSNSQINVLYINIKIHFKNDDDSSHVIAYKNEYLYRNRVGYSLKLD